MTTNSISTTTLLKELSDLITKGNAHVSFEDAVKDIPIAKVTETPNNLPYNIWQLVEHIRIAQWDILEFCVNPAHESPKWPDEYWVEGSIEITEGQWNDSLNQIKKDRDDFLKVLKNPDTNLYEPLAHGSGQNILREALLIADHNAYHIGEIILIRRLLNNWK